MTVVQAIFDKGVFRPVSAVHMVEGTHVEVLVPELPSGASATGSLRRRSIGILPAADADEMARIVAEEFGQVNPDDWR